jgi:diacylglycerol kinase family enzyme
MGRRARLDQGTLGILAAQLTSATQAVGLLRRNENRSVTSTTSSGEVIVDAETPTIPVGIDGEAVTVQTPVHCTVRPRALRVLLPRIRPGIPPPRPRIDWKRLWHIAFGH